MEGDRNLDDPATVLDNAVRHFDLEHIATGLEPGKVDLGECVGGVCAKAGCGICNGEIEHETQVTIPCATDQTTVLWPIWRGPARHVARADDEFRFASQNRGNKLAHHGWLMRKIGVHFDDDVIPAGKGDTKSGAVRGAETAFRSTTQQLDSIKFRPNPLDNFGGSIGAAVVYDEDVRLRDCVPNGTQHALNIFMFVVRRKDDQDRHGSQATFCAAYPRTMETVHPGIPPTRAFLLAFVAAVVGGSLGALVGFGYVRTASPSPTGEVIGALVGGVVTVIGCSIIAVLVLRARSQWHDLSQE